jgi:hypothetical protein
VTCRPRIVIRAVFAPLPSKHRVKRTSTPSRSSTTASTTASMSAYTIKPLEDKQALAYQTILASLPLEQRSDGKAHTYSGSPSTHTTNSRVHRAAPVRYLCRPRSPVPHHAPPLPADHNHARRAKRMELAWEDDGEDDYTGSQMWIFFVAGICECCAVTDAFCSTACSRSPASRAPAARGAGASCATAFHTGRAHSKRSAARASAPCLALTGASRMTR